MRRRPAPATGYFRVQLAFRHGLTCHHMSPCMNVAVYLATAIYDRDACWSDRHWAGNSPQCGRAFVFCGEGRRSRFLPQMYIYIYIYIYICIYIYIYIYIYRYTHTQTETESSHTPLCVRVYACFHRHGNGWMDGSGRGPRGLYEPLLVLLRVSSPRGRVLECVQQFLGCLLQMKPSLHAWPGLGESRRVCLDGLSRRSKGVFFLLLLLLPWPRNICL